MKIYLKSIACIIVLGLATKATAADSIKLDVLIKAVQSSLNYAPSDETAMHETLEAEGEGSEKILFYLFKKGDRSLPEAVWWRAQNPELRASAMLIILYPNRDLTIIEGIASSYIKQCDRFKDNEKKNRIEEIEWVIRNGDRFRKSLEPVMGK